MVGNGLNTGDEADFQGEIRVLPVTCSFGPFLAGFLKCLILHQVQGKVVLLKLSWFAVD